MQRLILPLLLCLTLAQGSLYAEDTDKYRKWIQDMKEQPRGPFSRLRWFCNDGTVLPPKAYACRDHGGGYQHGEWNEKTRTLRENGYLVANLLAGFDAPAMAAKPGFADAYAQLLIERFLIAADSGWIMRNAQFYRGAIQEEDEREGAQNLLLHLSGQPEWLARNFVALRMGARLLAHGQQSASAQKVRQESAALSERDKGFMNIRAKIHGAPDASDADRVRDYAKDVKDSALSARYAALAKLIDQVYQQEPLQNVIRSSLQKLRGAADLQKQMSDAAASLEQDSSARNRYTITASLLAGLRDSLVNVKQPDTRLQLLDLSLLVEDANFRASTELRSALSDMTRAQRIALLGAAAQAAYGAGLVKHRELKALQESRQRLSASQVSLADYLEQLRYLGRVAGWATQNLRFHFFESMQKLGEIEPKAMLFIQDQLRGSPLLFYSTVINGLSQDGNRLAGVNHKVFGKVIGSGFNALNPGIAVGTLHASPNLEDMESFDPKGIYVLPETVSDLPPIAGILTAGEGNPLSHVQLLARNLGIPNVSFNEDLLSLLKAQDGKRVVMAVSPAGLVELTVYNEAWQKMLGEQAMSSDVVIRPDLEKLDLTQTEFINLDDLRARDSGRTVGPKAAKLGELRHAFPESVAPGAAIPFGIFKAEVLDRPHRDSKRSVYDWMVAQYRALEAMPAESSERKEKTEAFRAELYQIILDTKPSKKFRDQLSNAMKNAFGSLNAGVFVRSDTNVEDLAGFTGAGLNLTLPNVIGYENLLQAINRVWASPFTARAFAWRQSHMKSPEHVYTSILLLGSVASDKSGVMVTQDLDSGDFDTISVAVNEGVGGAVDGQAAESLRINTRTGDVRLMATATAPYRRLPAADGGIEKLPASGSDVVLQPAEIKRLIKFARDELPTRFPAITDDAGNRAAADVEFGFLDGELRLFQIRPFLESRNARGNTYLVKMDQSLSSSMQRTVNLQEVPAK